MTYKIFTIVFLLFMGNLALGQEYSFEEHVELGDVHWLRNYNAATALAAKEDKSIFILFQEVPGCATCRNYGQNVMTHPLIVEAIESLFVPLCVFNNVGGKDRETLSYFKEPTWNNPVVRIVDTQGKNIVDRLGNDYRAAALVSKMCDALTANGQLIPGYLLLLEKELAARKTEEAYLSMYCFWTGEKNIGQIDGVIATEAGFMNGHEVVKTTYDPQKTNLKTIEKKAKKSGCADSVFTKENTFRSDREIKYYLQHSKYKSIPMTDMQAMKVNADLGNRKNPDEWLSPGQLKMKGRKGNFIGKEFKGSWVSLNL